MKKFITALTTKKAILIIVIFGITVYFNSLFNNFVLDDKTYIIFNTELHSLNLSTLFGKNVFNSNITGQYHPITAIYFAIVYTIFRNNPFFYHLFQIILHIINTILVFVFFKRILNNKLSLFLSLIFLVHPIQTEAVSYIAATGDPLFFLLGIVSLLISTKELLGLKRLGFIFSLLLLSTLSKETGFLFLVLILIYRILFRKGQILKFMIVGFIVLACYLFLRIGIAEIYLVKPELTPIANLSFMERMINIPAITFYYLKTFFYPANLATIQLWIVKNLDRRNFYLPLLADFLFLMIFVAIGLRIRIINKTQIRTYLFFVCWFLIGLGLHMQIFPIDHTVEDRFFYFPIVGLLGMIGFGVQNIKFSNKVIIKFSYGIAVMILLILSIRTIVRNTNWYDGVTLLTHDSKVSNNFIIENDLGTEYGFLRNYNEAINHYRKSVEMFPFDANLYDLALMYDLTNNIEEAKEYYYKAFYQKYSIPSPHKRRIGIYLGLAKILFFYDDTKKARDFIKEAVADYPDSGKLWILLAVSEYKLNNQEEALNAVEKAKIFLPNNQTNYLYSQIQKGEPVPLSP